MTLKMKFIQDPRLEFFEKKSSRFIIQYSVKFIVNSLKTNELVNKI